MTRHDTITALVARCAEVHDGRPVLSDDDLLELLGRANEMAYDHKHAAGRWARAALETVPECSVCSVCGVPFEQPGKCWCGVATKEGTGT